MGNFGYILFLAPQLYGAPGGVQTYMCRLREILTTYGESRGYQIHCLSLVDKQEERHLHPLPVEGGIFVGCSGCKARFIREVINLSRKHPYCMAIVGHIGPAPVAWGLKVLNLIPSYILVLHGIEAWRRRPLIERIAARSAARTVATTRYTAVEFSQHNGISSERLRLIPLAVAKDEGVPPANSQGNIGELAVLSVARLSCYDREKGIDTLLHAVGRVRNEGVKVHLTVVGSGNDLPRLRRIVVELGLDRQVTFRGILPDGELHELYGRCDVFAMPSKKEGFGIVFLEAMHSGKPCIGGNHGGIPEVISHGLDGYLVSYGDIDQLAQYLLEFSKKPELTHEMGIQGYRKVKAKYLFSHMRNRWFSLLDEVVGAQRRIV